MLCVHRASYVHHISGGAHLQRDRGLYSASDAKPLIARGEHHRGAVYALEFHPTVSNLMASGMPLATYVRCCLTLSDLIWVLVVT
mgnify:CR=1 FL=1